MTSRLFKTLLSAVLALGLSAGAALPAAAQTDTPASAALKSWYPRLSGLPYTRTDAETVIIGGSEYQNRTIQIAFFADTPKDALSEALGHFPTEAVTELKDRWSYEYTLQETDPLLAATDYFNDLAIVRSAHLLLIDTSDGTIDPTPVGPGTAYTGSGGVEALHPGDANGDGQYNVLDAVNTLRVIVGLQEFDPFAAARADVNRNGGPDVQDVVDILGLALGMGLPAPTATPPLKAERSDSLECGGLPPLSIRLVHKGKSGGKPPHSKADADAYNTSVILLPG